MSATQPTVTRSRQLPSPSPSSFPSIAPSNPPSSNTRSRMSNLTSALPSVADVPAIPTTDKAPAAHQARSHLVLVVLVLGTLGACWFAGFDLLQLGGHASWFKLALLLGGSATALVAVLQWTGLASTDFWELVHGYWWLSVPVVAAAALFATISQERATGLHEVE